MMLVDTHAHLYGSDFDNDIQEVLQRAYNNGVEKILLPAIDSETHDKLLALAAANPIERPDARLPAIYPMMGLHPCSVKEDYEKELETALAYLNNGTKYYAVGEIGLDFYWDVSYKEQQYKALEVQVQWAIERNLPIVIHSRKSTYECIEVLKKYKGQVEGVFHCFSGSHEEANEVLKLGFYLGIGGVLTYKNSGLRDVLFKTGIEKVILETDAPYLTPVPYRGKRNESSYIKLIAGDLAKAMGNTVEQIAEVTTENALKLFKLK
jgi:TatD DNase family protein